MPTSREVDNQTMAGVNSRFAKATEDNILWIQENAITSNTKKATRLGIKVSGGKQCLNTQFANISSFFCPHSLSQFWSPRSAGASLLDTIKLSFHGSIQSPIQVSSTFIEEDVSI